MNTKCIARPSAAWLISAAVATFISVLAAILCYWAYEAYDYDGFLDFLSPVGLAFAALGLGGEVALWLAGRSKRRKPPRLAKPSAAIATFLGAAVTVASAAASLGEQTKQYLCAALGVTLLALVLAAIAAIAVWFGSSTAPQSRAVPPSPRRRKQRRDL